MTNRQEYRKAWYKAHREEHNAYMKAYQKAHKEEVKEYRKAWYKANKEVVKLKKKAYEQEHKDEIYSRKKADLNSLGQTKDYIRNKSRNYLSKYGTIIQGYEIHHCFTYDDPNKFIYVSKSLHLKIHQYLRDNNIDADSNHYEQIKHLLDDTVVLYGIE